jgi:GT2 family glycosyltransferase
MITASIVTYKHRFDQIETLVYSIIKNDIISKLFVIDNSPFNNLQKEIGENNKIDYIFMGSNKGFGAAHNIAIQKSIDTGSNYHFIINPDIFFNEDIITPLIEYMKQHQNVGMLMPKILYPSGATQYLPKILPTPLNLILRKFKRPKTLYSQFIEKYELRIASENTIYNAPILSGCFTLLNLKAIKEIGAYDERFFMYFEDFDLSRRIHEKYKTIYYPLVSVYHGYEGGANKKFQLFLIFVVSAIKYFNKWGWIFDNSRRRVNKKVLIRHSF